MCMFNLIDHSVVEKSFIKFNPLQNMYMYHLQNLSPKMITLAKDYNRLKPVDILSHSFFGSKASVRGVMGHQIDPILWIIELCLVPASAPQMV